MFTGKSICIIGGSGYVGSAIAKRALQLGLRVSSVSRRGAPSPAAEWHKNVNYVPADALKPSTFAQVLEESNGIIYTVGTLIDTSITKKLPPGSPGTYEHLNRDCAIKVADHLSQLAAQANITKPMVYLSAEGHPPYIKRYITTKEEAEAHILSLLPRVGGTILKPGFIYSASDRWWSLPLKYNVDAWSVFQRHLSKTVSKDSAVGSVIHEFAVAQSVRLTDVVDCAIYSCFDSSNNGERLFNTDIEITAAKLRSAVEKQQSQQQKK